jgi:tetratricopeptide (TPR) repeat protein
MTRITRWFLTVLLIAAAAAPGSSAESTYNLSSASPSGNGYILSDISFSANLYPDTYMGQIQGNVKVTGCRIVGYRYNGSTYSISELRSRVQASGVTVSADEFTSLVGTSMAVQFRLNNGESGSTTIMMGSSTGTGNVSSDLSSSSNTSDSGFRLSSVSITSPYPYSASIEAALSRASSGSSTGNSSSPGSGSYGSTGSDAASTAASGAAYGSGASSAGGYSNSGTGTASVSGAARQKATELNRSGISAFKAGNYRQARDYFAQALQYLPDDATIRQNHQMAQQKMEEQADQQWQQQMADQREAEKQNRAQKEAMGQQIGQLGQVMFNQANYNYDIYRINYSTGPISSVSFDYGARYDFASIFARGAYNYSDKINFKSEEKQFLLEMDNLSLGLGASLFFGSIDGNQWGWSMMGLEIIGAFDIPLSSNEELADELELMYEYGIGVLWAEDSIGFEISYLIRDYDAGNYEFAEYGSRDYSDTFTSHNFMLSILF